MALLQGSCQTGGNLVCCDISVEGHIWMAIHTGGVRGEGVPLVTWRGLQGHFAHEKQDPTLCLCLGPYGGPKGGGRFS